MKLGDIVRPTPDTAVVHFLLLEADCTESGAAEVHVFVAGDFTGGLETNATEVDSLNVLRDIDPTALEAKLDRLLASVPADPNRASSPVGRSALLDYPPI